MKRIFLALAIAAIGCLWGTSSATAFDHYHRGHTVGRHSYGYGGPRSYAPRARSGFAVQYQGRNFSFGYGNTGYNRYPVRRGHVHGVYHDTSHYDYHPTTIVPHGNHYHVQPGHYDYHRSGHIDYYRH